MPLMPFSTRSFGTPSLNPLTRQMNALTSAYRRGVQLARRSGNPAEEIKFLNDAASQGIQATGIRRFEDRRARDVAFGNQLAKQSGVNAELTKRAYAGVGGAVNPDTSEMEAGPVTPGLDRLDAMQPKAPGETFAQRAARDVQEKSLSGAFGRGAQLKAQRGEAKNILADAAKEAQYTITDGPDGNVAAEPTLPDDARRRFLDRTRAIGGTEDQFNSAINRKLRPVAATKPREEEELKKRKTV